MPYILVVTIEGVREAAVLNFADEATRNEAFEVLCDNQHSTNLTYIGTTIEGAEVSLRPAKVLAAVAVDA